uniref:Uncharacterized protein n=1 Tax=Oryza sativa TaxID=4530 RepID=Q94HK3_ORYSA|nr:hypothetical protein [Oryza sativa]
MLNTGIPSRRDSIYTNQSTLLLPSYSFYNISLTRAAATKSTMSSGVAWVWMTEDAVASDELRRDRPRRAPGITDTGNELQRGARTAEDVAAATSPAWGATAEDAADSDVVLQHRRPPSTAPLLTLTSSSICVAGRCTLRQRPNSVASPLQSPPSSPAVDPAATKRQDGVQRAC